MLPIVSYSIMLPISIVRIMFNYSSIGKVVQNYDSLLQYRLTEVLL